MLAYTFLVMMSGEIQTQNMSECHQLQAMYNDPTSRCELRVVQPQQSYRTIEYTTEYCCYALELTEWVTVPVLEYVY